MLTGIFAFGGLSVLVSLGVSVGALRVGAEEIECVSHIVAYLAGLCIGDAFAGRTLLIAATIVAAAAVVAAPSAAPVGRLGPDELEAVGIALRPRVLDGSRARVLGVGLLERVVVIIVRIQGAVAVKTA